jgi:hypothetical protein
MLAFGNLNREALAGSGSLSGLYTPQRLENLAFSSSQKCKAFFRMSTDFAVVRDRRNVLIVRIGF